MARYTLDDWSKVASIVSAGVGATRLVMDLYNFFSQTGSTQHSQVRTSVDFEKSAFGVRDNVRMSDQQYTILQIQKQEYFDKACNILTVAFDTSTNSKTSSNLINNALELLFKITVDFEDPTLINIKSIYLIGICYLVLGEDNDYAVASLMDGYELGLKRKRIMGYNNDVDSFLLELKSLIKSKKHLVKNNELAQAINSL